MARQSVDLPDPEGPSTTTTWPRGTSSVISLSTCRSPKYLFTADALIIGAATSAVIWPPELFRTGKWVWVTTRWRKPTAALRVGKAA